MWSHTFFSLYPSLPVFIGLSAATILAGLMRGFSGFGSSLMLAPVYSLLLQPVDVLGTIILLNLLTAVQMVPSSAPHVNWQRLWALVIPCLAGIPLGLTLVHGVDASMLRRLIAVVVAIVSLVLLSGWQYRGRRGRVQDVVAGMSGGVLTSIAGIGGPPVILYLLSDRQIGASALRALFIFFFAFGQIATLLGMWVSDALALRQLWYALSMLPLFVLGTAFGTVGHQRLAKGHESAIRRVSLLLLLAIGIATLFM
jgi:uncharacterized membrane protein YfcA